MGGSGVVAARNNDCPSHQNKRQLCIIDLQRDKQRAVRYALFRIASPSFVHRRVSFELACDDRPSVIHFPRFVVHGTRLHWIAEELYQKHNSSCLHNNFKVKVKP